VYTSILIHTGNGEEGKGEEIAREKVREAIVHNAVENTSMTYCLSSL
jgi:hypothetical protein